MHGNNNVGFKHTDDLRGFGSVQRAAIADRHHSNINIAEFLNETLGGHKVDLAKVKDGQFAVVEHIKCVTQGFSIQIVGRGLDACDENASAFILSRSGDLKRISFILRLGCYERDRYN